MPLAEREATPRSRWSSNTGTRWRGETVQQKSVGKSVCYIYALSLYSIKELGVDWVYDGSGEQYDPIQDRWATRSIKYNHTLI